MPRFLRYAAVGAVATAVHYLLLVLCVEGGRWPAFLASGFGASVGAQVAYAIALAQAGALDQARGQLATLDAARVKSYQAFWVASAHVEALEQQFVAAQASLTRAIGLTGDPATRAYLQQKLASLARFTLAA